MTDSGPNSQQQAEIANGEGLREIEQGKAEAALAAFHRAIRLNPGNPAYYSNASLVLERLGRAEEAIAALRQAVRLGPGHAILHNNLSVLLEKQRLTDAAVDAAREAVRLEPPSARFRYTLARAIQSTGDLDGADREFAEALRIDPNFDRAADSRAFLANFNPSFDAARILEICRDWSRRFEPPAAKIAPHKNSSDPNRQLKIGYVSAAFHDHAEAFFVLPLLEAHDREHFEIHCFSNGAKDDAITSRHRRAVDRWHPIRGMDDHHAVALIRKERIDVLVDLTMHMADSRLRLFAVKPAPVQMTWLAYPGTTGLRAMDYRITDAVIDPPGAGEPYSEQSIYLPTSWICWDPLEDVEPRRQSSRNYVAFASFNNPFKMNDGVVRLWGQVLQRVPNSRIAMLSSSAWQRERIRAVLKEMGIIESHIAFSPPLGREQYLRLHNEIDIALDTQPYNGITTSCDALWMGVPVVTTKGSRAAGRAGSSLLDAAGLPELVAQDQEQFIEIAAALATDSGRLRAYHEGLREKVRGSPLMDSQRFTREIESAYRDAWRRWCGMQREK
jgi:predicted O-linked N-acetylglucosamine transferase (SPINDLY family)